MREERRVHFRLKGRREIPLTVVRYRWAISGRNARPGSVAELSKPWLTRRRIQRPRMIYRSRIGIISFSVSLSELGLGKRIYSLFLFGHLPFLPSRPTFLFSLRLKSAYQRRFHRDRDSVYIRLPAAPPIYLPTYLRPRILTL